MAVASVVLAAGGSVRASYVAAAFMGAATILGVVLTAHVGVLTEYGLALSAGVTIYVAASNLVPEFQAKRGWALPAAFFGGATALVLLQLLIP